MAVFDVDFAFSCPYYVSDIQHALAKSTKKYEIRACISGKHVVKNFEVDYFKNEKDVFVSCSDHLWDGMQHNTGNCLHYNRRVFFRSIMIIVVIRLKSAINVIEEVFANIV